MTFNVPLLDEVLSGTGFSFMSLFVFGDVLGPCSISDSDVESSLSGLSTHGEESAFCVRCRRRQLVVCR